jgi:hypothetical protein
MTERFGRALALIGIAACLMVAGCGKSTHKSESASGAASPTAAAPGVIALAPPFQKESGNAWIVPTLINPATRKLRVFEDGKELGPGDSMHADIRATGKGAYSHWDTKTSGFAVYFSTSDNSDPNTNGRAYTLR